MKFLHSLVSNSFLMLVLFAMLFLPIGAMGLSTMQRDDTEVLSQTSVREQPAEPTQTEQVVQEASSSDKLWKQIYDQQNEQTPQNYSEQ